MIDIPDPLYRKAEKHGADTGQSLKQIVVSSLSDLLEPVSIRPAGVGSFIERRKLRPGFRRLMESGALGGGTDSTVIVSEDRSSRENTLL